jgi:hypothetical protein
MSEDRITWIQQHSPEAATIYSVTYRKNRFLAVGADGKWFKIELILRTSQVS